MKNTVHFILQGKGGIGKSFVSSLLAQYLKSKTGNLKAFDTDQVNTTFAFYKALGVEQISLTTGFNEIDPKGFDIMIEKLITEDGPFVIDNGANTFSPLLSYMVESDIFSLLRDSGKQVYVHTIVGGGDTMADTANGFNSIARGIGDTPLVLWLNEHFGLMKTVEGKDFIDTKVFKTHEDGVLFVFGYTDALILHTYGNRIFFLPDKHGNTLAHGRVFKRVGKEIKQYFLKLMGIYP